jgi:hypothetical protein
MQKLGRREVPLCANCGHRSIAVDFPKADKASQGPFDRHRGKPSFASGSRESANSSHGKCSADYFSRQSVQIQPINVATSSG